MNSINEEPEHEESGEYARCNTKGGTQGGGRHWWLALPASRIDPETESFMNWHASKDSKFFDWKAAWRNWIAKGIDYASDKRGNAPASKLSKQQYGMGVGVDGQF